MPTNIQLPSKENLKETLDIGNFTGNGQRIVPENGDGGLDLRNQNTDNIVVLTNNFGGILGYLILSPGSMQVGFNAISGMYLEVTPTEAFLRSVALPTYLAFSTANGGLRALSAFGSGFSFVIVENSVDRSQGTISTENIFLNTGTITASIIKAGVVGVVILGGDHITAKTSNSAYANRLILQEPGSSFDNELVFPAGATQDNTYTFPNKSGTVALEEWTAPVISLGSLLAAGATFFINPGAGVYLSFDGGSDGTAFFNVCLHYNTIPYDGSDLEIVLKGRISSNGAVGDTVGIILEYAINGTGDDTTLSTLLPQQNVDVSSELADIQFEISLGTMTGAVGASQLMVSITRNATGVDSDTYSGNYELTSIMINKI